MLKVFSTVVLTAAIAAAQCTVQTNPATGRLDCLSMPASAATYGTRNMVTNQGVPNNGAQDANGAIVAALNSGPYTYVFPAGDYRINNDGGPMVIANFNGKLSFNPGARFVCTNSSKMCVQFTFGSPKIDGLSLTYVTPATTRTDNAVGVFFYQGNDQQLTNATVSGSGGPGIQFQESQRPYAMNIQVSNTMADGFDYFNCLNATISGLHTEITGDDGLAFVNYAMYQNYNGGAASNIRVNNANARGISIVGTSNVAVTGFIVSNTTNAGAMCITDTYYGTRTGINNSFANGVIVGAGSYKPASSWRPNGINGNPFGIEWQMPANQGSCSFDTITLSNVTGNPGFGASNTPRGISGGGGQSISFHNITVDGVSGDGFNGGSANLSVDTVTVKNASGYAFFLSGYGQPSGATTNVTAYNLTAMNSGFGLTGGIAGRAMGFEHNANMAISNLKLIDTQPVPTGYIVEEWNNSTGTVAGITASISHGGLAVQNSSGGVTMLPNTTVYAQPNDPGCHVTADISKAWIDMSSLSMKVCTNVNGSINWTRVSF